MQALGIIATSVILIVGFPIAIKFLLFLISHPLLTLAVAFVLCYLFLK